MVKAKLPPPLTEQEPPLELMADPVVRDAEPCPTCSIVWKGREGPVPTIGECRTMPNAKGRHMPGDDKSKIAILPPPPRKVFVQPMWKVCIEVPGQTEGAGVSAMWDRGASATGLQFPNELRSGSCFTTEAEASAAAEKYTIYRNAIDGVAASKTSKTKPKKR